MSAKYDLYVDGSAIGNINVDANTPTGWSMVCVNKNNESMVNEIYGRVATDPNLENYIGAEVGSNNTAEITALYEALLFIEQGHHLSIDAESYTIYGDSMYAGKMAMGEWNPKQNKKLVKNLVKKWNSLKRLGISFSWEHIKAHSGHLWNERADYLARETAKGNNPSSLNDWRANAARSVK